MKKMMSVVMAGMFAVSVSGIIEAADVPNPPPASSPSATEPSAARQRMVKKLRDRNMKARTKSGTTRDTPKSPATASGAAQTSNEKQGARLQERNQNARENSKNLGVGGGTSEPQSAPR